MYKSYTTRGLKKPSMDNERSKISISVSAHKVGKLQALPSIIEYKFGKSCGDRVAPEDV